MQLIERKSSGDTPLVLATTQAIQPMEENPVYLSLLEACENLVATLAERGYTCHKLQRFPTWVIFLPETSECPLMLEADLDLSVPTLFVPALTRQKGTGRLINQAELDTAIEQIVAFMTEHRLPTRIQRGKQ